MTPSRRLPIASILTLLLVASISSASTKAYVDPALQPTSGSLSVIVTATSSKVAAQAVRAAGGIVTGDLWIINAVDAALPASSIARLAADTRIVSIVENKKVKASAWNGWVSDIRENKGQYATSSQIAGVGHLPDGGFAAIAQGGELMIVNADGTERKRVTLSGAPFQNNPVVSDDGTIYVLGNYKVLSAVRSDGFVKWTAMALGNNYYRANVVIGPDGTVYTVDDGGTLYAYDPDAGFLKWSHRLPSKGQASFAVTPAIGPDGTLYITNNRADFYAVTSAGVLWTTSLPTATQLAPQMSSGNLLIASGSSLLVLNPANGSIVFSFTTSGAISNPAIGSDGSIYVTSKGSMTALTATGRTKWSNAPTDVAYVGDPLVTTDGNVVFSVVNPSKGKWRGWIQAFDPATGTMKWNQSGIDEIALQPTIDPDGGILLVDNSTKYRRLNSAGEQTDAITLQGTASFFSRSSYCGNVVIQLGTSSVSFLGRLPDHWNGKKDVQATSSKTAYQLVNPVSVDVGADILHKTTVTSGTSNYIKGGDQVVAVIDSGVYWDNDTKMTLGGTSIQRSFLGQADFIKSLCGYGTQYTDYCFNDFNNSLDAYGHGTHVAGIIMNKLTDQATGAALAIAPESRILSARVLDANGSGTYATVIKGIQWVIANKSVYGVRIMNLSLSAYSTVPYFVDPLDRAVERAWQSGIVVVAAAGNTGPFAQSITVPGNDPYVITVGAVSSGRTPAYWRDDIVTLWSATGPTYDGFAKPDVVAPGGQIVSYMYNGGLDDPNTATLVRLHPDYSVDAKLFRMNGTSMATAVTSGVVALMLQVNPALTPNQVKYRLMNTARWAINASNVPVYNTFQQGLGRLWAPDAVLSSYDPAGSANLGMDINADLAHGYDTLTDLTYHYQGPVQKLLSDSGTAYLYYGTDSSGTQYALGVTDLNGKWLDSNTATQLTWAGTRLTWAGGISFTGDANTFSSTRLTWAGIQLTWAGTRLTWAGARYTWAGTQLTWAGGTSWTGGAAWTSTQLTWAGSDDAYATTRLTWAGAVNGVSGWATSLKWVDDNWLPPAVSSLPPPAGAK